MPAKVYLFRHGETAWSLSGQHTGSTEVPLTPEGEARARLWAPRLASLHFDLVLVSPRQRARRTCELAGLGPQAQTEADLCEWNYGDYEGLKSTEIWSRRPGWCLFTDGCPNGESPEAVGARADGLVRRLRFMEGRIALFSHGHFGRVLGARWIDVPAVEGRRFLFDAGCLGLLGYERNDLAKPVHELWNFPPSGELPS